MIIQTGLNVFRNTTTGTYGWKYNQGFTNTDPIQKFVLPDNRADQPGQLCLASSAPLDCAMNFRLTNDCETNSPFKAGEHFGMTTAGFVDYTHKNNDPNNPVIFAKYDGGAPRFYSFEQLYVVGKGMVPWYGTLPALNTTPIPDDALTGGSGSVSYNYSEEPYRVFQQSVNNIGITDMQRFVEGRRLFHTSFLDGAHSENPTINPPLAEHANPLGARFNSVRCLGCHTLNGRSAAATHGNPISSHSILTAASSAENAFVPDPVYGMNISSKRKMPTPRILQCRSSLLKRYRTLQPKAKAFRCKNRCTHSAERCRPSTQFGKRRKSLAQGCLKPSTRRRPFNVPARMTA